MYNNIIRKGVIIINHTHMEMLTSMSIYICLTNLASLKPNLKNVVICISSIILMKLILPNSCFLLVPIIVGVIFYFIEKKEIMIGIIYTTLSFIICIIIDILIEYIMLIVLKKDLTNLNTIKNEYLIMFFIIYILILFSTTLVIKKILNEIINIKNILFKVKNKILIMLLLITTLLIYLINIKIGHSLQIPHKLIKFNLIIFTTYFLIICFAIVILLKYIEKDNTIKNNQKEMTYIIEYMENVEKLNNEMRKFKHDYGNIISGMHVYIEEENIRKIKEYFHNNVIAFGDQMKNNDLKLGLLHNLKVTEVKGLIAYKLIIAEKLNIKINLEITDEIQTINMKSVDICRCLGIIIDNAIDACSIIKNSQVDIALIKDDTKILIVVENKFEGQAPSIKKIYKQGYSTKGENRGLGLSILNDIIKDYKNISLQTEICENKFIQRIYIKQKI